MPFFLNHWLLFSLPNASSCSLDFKVPSNTFQISLAPLLLIPKRSAKQPVVDEFEETLLLLFQKIRSSHPLSHFFYTLTSWCWLQFYSISWDNFFPVFCLELLSPSCRIWHDVSPLYCPPNSGVLKHSLFHNFTWILRFQFPVVMMAEN